MGLCHSVLGVGCNSRREVFSCIEYNFKEPTNCSHPHIRHCISFYTYHILLYRISSAESNVEHENDTNNMPNIA